MSRLDSMLSRQPRPIKIALVVLLLAIIATYANSFDNGFHFDDFHTVVDNPAVRSLKNVPRFFADATTFSVLPANRTYRPMVSAGLALDYALGHGYVPFWFHLSTFVLFLGLVGLLFGLYELLLDKIRPAPMNAWLALGAAAWFALHPAIAETVNYIIQRGDLYCTLGCVAALYLYARYPQQRRWGFYLLPFAFAMLSKPPAAVFPLLLLAYRWYFESDERTGVAARWRNALVAAIPSVAATALLLWLQVSMTPKSFAPTILSAADYRLTQPFVSLRYFGTLLLPIHLNVDTDLQPFTSFNPEALAGGLFVFSLGVAIWACSRRRTLYPVAFGLVWFLVAELPTSVYALSEVENDHRMFFAFAGLILAVVWACWLAVEWLGAEWLARGENRPWLRPVAAGVATALLCGYAYGSHQRNKVWRDEETLWRDDVQKSPHNGRGLMNFALAEMSKGDYTTALSYLTRAQAYTPNYATLEINLGIVNGALADGGDAARSSEAERHFLRAIALAPGDDGPHTYYGRWLMDHGREAEAIAQLETAVALNPQRPYPRELLVEAYGAAGDRAAAWINLSLAQYQQAQYAQSIATAQRALALDPNSAEAYNNMGAAYGAMGDWDQGIGAETTALRLDPKLQIAANNLRWFVAQKASGAKGMAGPGNAADYLNASLRLNQAGKFEESLTAARGALKLDPKMAEAWNNIAADDEAMHRWDPAIDAAQKAIALKPDFQLAKNNLAWSLAQKQGHVK
jgi:uncharacterized protein (TIGR02996 family)